MSESDGPNVGGPRARGTAPLAEPAGEIIRYEKDPATRVATITFDRPEQLNAPTIAARIRYADLLHRASIDDDVKVLVIRGANIGQWYANPHSGIRGLQDFKKISILEVKGYCYGWHFYQAADADLVISSDDAVFGHPSFRYHGWGPRMWWWAQTMGIRTFQAMVFTGRPFTAAEMFDCNFLNAVVPRADLEAEVDEYALACARNRPTDTVFMQKTFFEIMKQFQGEYLGSMLAGVFESITGGAQHDSGDLRLGDAMDRGLSGSVKDNDANFPPEWRLSKAAKRAAATAIDKPKKTQKAMKVKKAKKKNTA